MFTRITTLSHGKYHARPVRRTAVQNFGLQNASKMIQFVKIQIVKTCLKDEKSLVLKRLTPSQKNSNISTKRVKKLRTFVEKHKQAIEIARFTLLALRNC